MGTKKNCRSSEKRIKPTVRRRNKILKKKKDVWGEKTWQKLIFKVEDCRLQRGGKESVEKWKEPLESLTDATENPGSMSPPFKVTREQNKIR